MTNDRNIQIFQLHRVFVNITRTCLSLFLRNGNTNNSPCPTRELQF